MYEGRHHRPLSRARFLRRMMAHAASALGLVGVSLAIGMAGYRYFEHLSWHDAFLDSAMLLGGMGPVHPPETPPGKLFAGCYALYAGLVFLVVVGVMLAPVLHRMLHKFHWQAEQK